MIINKMHQNQASTLSWKGAGHILLLVLIATALAAFLSTPDNSLTPVVAFQFDTYCPVNTASALTAINAELDLQGLPPLDFDYKVNPNIYVVHTQARPANASDPSSPAMLYYCGWAKKWWDGSCSNARYVCSAPGPMFYFAVKQQATIIWVNAINATGLNWIESSCYNSSSEDHDCTTTTKPIERGSCSYFSPTDYQSDQRGTFRVRQTAVPISPHIHGLEIRPTFDGNPLSWFAPDGNHGSGFHSLHKDAAYYSLFRKQVSFKGQKSWPEQLSRRAKVIVVNNDQAPGLLFYHDHAMKSTLYNVQNGLGGLWVIYDPEVEAGLPSGRFQRFIVFSKQGDARTNVSPDFYTLPNQQPEFERGATYRFRILNAAFDNSFNNVVFAAYYRTILAEDGTATYQEIDPSNSTYDLDDNKHLISFSVIGTDTTLFHKAVQDVSFLNFGPAERADLLINFGSELPDGVNNVYFVCYDNNEGADVIKYQFQIQPAPQTLLQKLIHVLPAKRDLFRLPQPVVSQEQISMPSDYLTLNVPFTNLSLVPEKSISVRRHRPLFTLPNDTRFMIGAHYMFQDGKTDQAKIGTVDDFYLINNLFEDHPMHIHLVNHQAVRAYSLKRLPENDLCTLYFLDYFRNAKAEFASFSNLELCDYLWNLEDDQVLDLFMSLKEYMPEDEVKNGVSGMDVMALSGGDEKYLVGNCSMDSSHKYICDDTTEDILPHERRWKDTSMVHKYSVFVLRVRWASTTYDPQTRPYPYFNIPEEHLTEFPGFVYHCHILPHEDNEMMRSYTLQHSDFYVNNFLQDASCARTSWKEQLECINKRLGCTA